VVSNTLAALSTLAIVPFRMYIAGFGRYNRVYGAVGSVIVLRIWVYIAALAVLVGGELAATLESGGAARGARPAGNIQR